MLGGGTASQENGTFSLDGKMLIGFASVFKIAHVHLPVFTKSCIWDALFLNNKILSFVSLLVFFF